MSSLNRRNDEMKHLMNARTDKRNEPRPKILPGYKQDIFRELHELSGDDYQDKLKELKIRWDMKRKLSND